MKVLKYSHSFEVVAELPAALQPLKKLAMNFRWSWHADTWQLFSETDPKLWDEVEHNPLELLNRLSKDRKDRLAADPVYMTKLEMCSRQLDHYLGAKTWFDERFGHLRDETLIAYFCAEFGINESLPIYSGGLGVLAGDHLKAASDLGIPLVGIGLLYSRGYFRQSLNADGWQQENYPNYDFYHMPLQLVRGIDNEPLTVSVEFPDRMVTCQIWKAEVGRVSLYLLDSNVLENAPDDQGITDTLYGGDENMRIRQEMILGIGGMRALKALGIKPTVCHMNEGHAAFLSLERLHQFMEEHQCDFRTARQVVVAGNVFTTHTPVPAGFDVFKPALIEQYLLKSIERVGLNYQDFLRLGRINPDDINEPFNMAVLAMENANRVNGVSKLHAQVSRQMFSGRWSEYPIEEVPVDAITNGIHTATWMSDRMGELFDRHLGPTWREDPSDPSLWDRITEIPDQELWDIRENQRGDFVRFVRRRLVRQLSKRNASRTDLQAANQALDPRILTIGFARRFATYKRASLMFADKERLKAILGNPDRPVQIVFAGKSHPRDDGGKALIQEIWRFINHEGGRSNMVFVEDYDMEVARQLVQGVDVWLNNPRRPMEASGTSGMKVVPNGGLNCSVLDGWWAEGYRPGVGWAIGDGAEMGDNGHQDWLESRALYQLIEQEIAPLFYNRGESGLPTAWIEMMKKSMRDLAPRFSTARMVREYTSRFYMPSSQAFNALQANNLDRAKTALQWRSRVRSAWKDVRFLNVCDDGGVFNEVGRTFKIRAEVSLGALRPDEVRVQALVGTVGGNRELNQFTIHDMELTGEQPLTFETTVLCDEPGHKGYTLRIVPFNEDVRVASELALIAWQ